MNVGVFTALPGRRIPRGRVSAVVGRVLAGERVRNAQVTVVFIGDAAMRRLNRRFLGHGGTTDVVSFALNEPGDPLEGEVYVNLDQARRQARVYGVSESDERMRLVVHGVLHLAGWLDGTSAARSRMRRREDRYLPEAAARERAHAVHAGPKRPAGSGRSAPGTPRTRTKLRWMRGGPSGARRAQR